MRLTLLLTLLLVQNLATAAPLTLSSGPDRVSVIELFTSEGCSSCPPADRWLSALRDDRRLWSRLVPVAFHVDYWDYIGWRDRFASPAHSDRQRRHASLGNVRSVYTPGFVVDGREWRAWFRGQNLDAPPASSPGTLRAEIDGERVRVDFTPTTEPAGPLLVTVARLGLGLETRVAAGENDGRTLRHDFVVLGLRQAPMPAAAGTLTVRLALPVASVEAPETAVAIWVSTGEGQRPLQALGGPLPGARR